MKRLIKGGLIGAVVYLAIVLLSQNVDMSLLNQLVRPILIIFSSLVTLSTSGIYAGAIILGFIVGVIATLIVGMKKKKKQTVAKSKPKKSKKKRR
ncbi:MAG: hypothetical protein WCP89_01890 [archaeon]